MAQVRCSSCGTLYEVVKVETDQTVPGGQLSCLSCGGPLPAREGQCALKWFRLTTPEGSAALHQMSSS